MREVHVAAIALGSNLPSTYGNPEDNLRVAVEKLGTLGRVTAVSSMHLTEPVGFVHQPMFVNGVLLLETELDPFNLLRSMLEIEVAMGRVRAVVTPKGPRIIDLDLIFYGGEVINTAQLQLPHPTMMERGFVLAPLAEIAPDWVHPVSLRTVREMLEELETVYPSPPSFCAKSSND